MPHPGLTFKVRLGRALSILICKISVPMAGELNKRALAGPFQLKPFDDSTKITSSLKKKFKVELQNQGADSSPSSILLDKD